VNRKVFRDLRPADSLNLVFLFFLSLVVLMFHGRLNSPGGLAILYAALFVVQVLLLRFKKSTGLMRWTYDLIFPTVCILIVFDSLEGLVHSINPRDIDPLLIRLDYAIFGFYPTVMAEKFLSPLLTDFMQLAYCSYYVLPITLGVFLKINGEARDFDHALFLIMLCFYLSYVGYMLMPALGPRYTIAHLQNADLGGYLIAGGLQDLLNRLEGIKRDAFPSGHTGVALTVLYLSRVHAKGLFRFFLPCVIALILSTVYCRYHYVVDVLGGILLALITIYLGEAYYGYRTKRIDTDR
jgi:membrane-associated phospholipid phosphatase